MPPSKPSSLSFMEVAKESLTKHGHGGSHSHGGSHGERPAVSFQEQMDMSDPFHHIKGMTSMERELRISIAKLYQNYDFVTDEYDRLYEIIDHLREEYNNSKGFLIYHRYKEFKRIIKNSLRKWRTVEKRSTLAMSRKQSNASYAMALNGSNRGAQAGTPSGNRTIDETSSSYSTNLNARLRAQNHSATRDLYGECTRLEREIFQYKSKNQDMKNLLCKLASDYDNSKAHVLHIWGRYKELQNMIKEVICADV